MVFEEKEFKDSFSSIVQYHRYLQLLKDHNIQKLRLATTLAKPFRNLFEHRAEHATSRCW